MVVSQTGNNQEPSSEECQYLIELAGCVLSSKIRLLLIWYNVRVYIVKYNVLDYSFVFYGYPTLKRIIWK